MDFADVTIRPAAAVDADAVARVYAPHVESSYASFEEVAPSAATMAERMAAPPLLPWLVAEIDGDVVGFAYASHHRVRPAYRWSVDSSVYLDAGATGRGVGTALYERLVPILVDLGYVNLFAAIALPNDASVRLHRAQGFVEIGRYRDVGFKLGAWHDVAWFQRLLRARPADPSEPDEWSASNRPSRRRRPDMVRSLQPSGLPLPPTVTSEDGTRGRRRMP